MRFLMPKPTKAFALRLALVAAMAFVLFGVVFPPFRIKGSSMDPTYRDGGFVIGFRWLHARRLDVGDVVFVRLAGKRVMYLKRVIAQEGDTVAFEDGVLLVNGHAVDEAYVHGECDWNLAERTVTHGFVYVVGDNRSMPIDGHLFGQVSKKRITGGPLW